MHIYIQVVILYINNNSFYADTSEINHELQMPNEDDRGKCTNII